MLLEAGKRVARGYLMNKYMGYRCTFVDSDQLEDGTLVYVYRLTRGISNFFSTVSIKDSQITDVVS